jgi:hypothetical protein
MPLAPDQDVLQTLNNLQGLSEDYKQWLSNVESLPPKPTAEEIAAREEAIKQAQAAAAKNKGKPGAPGAPVIEEYKEPEPTWEPEPFNFLDSLFNDE